MERNWNKDKCTTVEMLLYAAVYIQGGCYICSDQLVALLCAKWRHGLNLVNSEIQLVSIGVYLFEEHSGWVLAWSDLK